MHHSNTPDGMGMDRHRERQNMREAARERTGRMVHRCRSCRATFDESHETCPECGYTDEHSTHGATQVESQP